MIKAEFKIVNTFMKKFEDAKVYNVFVSSRNPTLLKSKEDVAYRFTVRNIKNIKNLE